MPSRMDASSASAWGRNAWPASVRTMPLADPLEERRAQLALEQTEAPADGGLREVEGRGRPSEPAETHDGDEGLELVDLHRHQHSVWARQDLCIGRSRAQVLG